MAQGDRTDPDRVRPGGRPSLSDGVEEPFQDGSLELSLNGPRGTQFIQLVGVKGSSEQEKLHNALTSADIPKLGSPHVRVVGAVVRRVRGVFMPDSPSQVMCEIEWGFLSEGNFNQDPSDRFAEPSIEISTTIQQAVTSKDVEGNFIILTGDQLGETDDSTSDVLAGPPQLAKVEYPLAMTTVIVRRREGFSPGPNSKLYVGKVNENPSATDLTFGDEDHYWMCTRLGGFSEDAGTTWNVTYEFQRHPDNWNVNLVYLHPATGLPISRPVPGKSVLENVRIIPAKNFYELDLRLEF